MSVTRRPDFHFGGKLFLAILLALALGYLWACVEAGRSPLDIVNLFKESPPAAPVAKKELPTTKPVAPKKVEPPKSAPIAVKKAPPAALPIPGPRMYSAIEMGGLFKDLDEHLRRGRFFEAREKLQNTSRLMIPQDAMAKFTGYDDRVGLYHALLMETTKGGTIDKMPQMTQVLIKNAGKLVVKVLSENEETLTYETLMGIRSKIAKNRCEEIKPLTPVYASVEVSLELKKQADYRGLAVETEPGKPMVLKDQPGRKTTAIQIFDLADFCARNGANDKLVPLFDEALRRDADLLATVHETKADRMVEVLFYFVSVKSASDVARTSDILRERYADTKSYRERVAGDPEVKPLMEFALVRKPAEPVAKPAENTQPVPDPAPVQPEPPEIERITEPGRPIEPTSVSMPVGTAPAIVDLISRGDKFFIQAKQHLEASNPAINPNDWADENKKALEFFVKANQDCYLKAQNFYVDGSPPMPLLDRVREATMCTALCRKRSVRSRQ
jgi:hypothetical protein